MNCTAVIERLGAYRDGESAAGESSAIAEHLAGCARCRAALDAVREDHAALAAALAPHRARRDALEARVLRAASESGPPRPAPRRRARLLAPLATLAAGFLLGAFVFAPRTGDESGPSVARLALATGLVERFDPDAGTWQALPTGAALAAGARIRTTPASKCSFESADGSELRLDSGADVTVAAERRFALAAGRVFARVASGHPKPFEIATPEGRIEAVGTALDVARHAATESDAAHVRLTVVEGAARVGGETVEAGSIARIEGGAVRRRDPAGDLVLATGWMNEIVALKGPDDAEFARRVNDLLAQLGRTKMQFLYEAQIRAMGDHCALPLLRYVQSDGSRVEAARRREAVKILADIAGPPLAVELLPLLEDGDADVRALAARGLERLTGMSLGRDEAYWRGEDVGAGVSDWRTLLTGPESPWKRPPR